MSMVVLEGSCFFCCQQQPSWRRGSVYWWVVGTTSGRRIRRTDVRLHYSSSVSWHQKRRSVLAREWRIFSVFYIRFDCYYL